MIFEDRDIQIRCAAIDYVQKLQADRHCLSWSDVKNGFLFQDRKIFLATKARGIFKPKQMTSLLSIRTSVPKPGRKIWYDDQIGVHNALFSSGETVEYAFMAGGADKPANQLLREAWERQLPIIYFLGVAPAQYIAAAPVFIGDWDAQKCSVRISFGLGEQKIPAPPKTDIERKYALRQVKQRVHQSFFREALLHAYDRRCALSNLKEVRLLDAAHIVPDPDKELGQPTVSNGLLLSKIHHAAFDAHLIGVDPDYRMHISEKLLAQRDGPMLEALQQLNGKLLRLPAKEHHFPDPDRLKIRFEEYCKAEQA